MKATENTAQDFFGSQIQYFVPAYQRTYVWELDRQWQPLWDDIERLADARIENREESHFLGAIVLQEETGVVPGGVSKLSVIDGQQRLTTLQLMYSAMASAALGDGAEVESRLLSKLTLHDEDLAKGDDRFRFWPTTANRDAYRAMMAPGGPDGEAPDDPENTIQEAWEFFRDSARDYASREVEKGGVGVSDPEAQLAMRYGALREAAVGMLQVVVIKLDANENAQVIFETLNARGTRLLATDLVKNALFGSAASENADLDEVQEKLWAPGLGDIEYWSEEERLGRITVERSEAFLMHWLVMKLGEVTATDMLFDRFRRAFLDDPNAPEATDLLAELRDDAQLVRSFGDLEAETPAGRFLRTTRMLDTTVFHPLVLAILRRELSQEVQQEAFGALDSFLVRRLICRLTTKNYNRQVVDLVKAVQEAEPELVAEALVSELLESQADTLRWPTDEEVRDVVCSRPIYNKVKRERIVALLSAIEIDLRSGPMSEGITDLPPALQVEHVMPQSWNDNWPLTDPDSSEEAVRRDDHIHLLGNLTLISPKLNVKLSNDAWQSKREQLEANSMLLMNKEILDHAVWDESAIDVRGELLADRLTDIWPGAQHYMPDSWVGPTGEISPENADLDSDQVREIYRTASPYLRELLLDLAAYPDQRRSYAEIEDSIGWPRRRLASVLGGFRSAYRDLGEKRPYRIHMDEGGVWWMWLGSQAAGLIDEELAAEGEGRAAAVEEARERITNENVGELIDLIPERVAELDGLECRMFEGTQQVVINGPNGRSVSGYFAKEWLFLWLRGRFPGDHAWFSARLSEPDQVVVNRDGILRFHVRDSADLEVVLDCLGAEPSAVGS